MATISPLHARSIALSVLLAFVLCASAAEDSNAREFIGWLGERSRAEDADGDDNVNGMRVLSWHPRIFLYRGILTDEECDQLITDSVERLQPSAASETDAGGGAKPDASMLYARGENDVIKRIEQRLAMWTMLPASHGEGIQVLRYEQGQQGAIHDGALLSEGSDAKAASRMATILMYLAEPEEGGETVFPKVPVPAWQKAGQGYSKCAMQGLAHKPKKGDALLFWTLRPDGYQDSKSQHNSCPIIKGVKWTATKWMHVGPYEAAGGS